MRQALPPLLLAASFALLLLSACEEMVDPFLESDRQFTLFGTLDMSQDTQFVRVIPIRGTLDPGPPEQLDLRFTSEDRTTGETLVWRDSVLFFEDGTYGHVFYAPLRLRTGHTYRIEVRYPDADLVTSAETTVPEAPQITVFPEAVSGGGGSIAAGSQQTLWRGVDRKPFRIALWYRFLVAPRSPFRDVVLPYEPENEAMEPASWAVNLDLRRDRFTLDTLVNVEEEPLLGIGLQITVLDTAFVPPGGVFDPEVLVQPGTFSNVENGFGFIGSVGRFSVEWVLQDDSVRRLRYLSPEDVFGKSWQAAAAQRAQADVHAYPGHHPGLQ